MEVGTANIFFLFICLCNKAIIKKEQTIKKGSEKTKIYRKAMVIVIHY